MASSAASTASRSTRRSRLGAIGAIGCAAVALLASRGAHHGGGVIGLPFYETADFTAEWIAPTEPRYRSIHTIAPFSLVDQEGAVVSSESLRGKIYVANFFFTRCQDVCPRMAVGLRKVQSAFRDDAAVVLVSHSVMPSVDSVETLRAYGAQNGVRPGKWHLVTGEKEVIYGLARRSYFVEKRLGVDKKPNELLHTENMVLVDRHGRIRGIYNATVALDAERLIEDIRALAPEP
jgi:protein SCO1